MEYITYCDLCKEDIDYYLECEICKIIICRECASEENKKLCPKCAKENTR